MVSIDYLSQSAVPLRGGQTDHLRVVRRCLFTMIFVSIFLQRFALGVGKVTVPFSLFVNIAAIALLTLLRRTNVDALRSSLVLLFVAYAALAVAFSASGSTMTSAIYVVAMYIPFSFVLQSGDAVFMDCVRAYRSMMLICAIAGILQFILQFVISNSLLFTFEGHAPSAILLKGYNTYAHITYGSSLYRSNGFVMIEPSTFSQFVGLAVIIELIFFQVGWRLFVYAAALLFSYSGTGVIILALVPAILLSRRAYRTIVALALVAALALATPQLWNMSLYQERAKEFNDTGSSAHSRYVAPANLIAQYQVPRTHDLLFGIGPGSITPYGNLLPYDSSDPSWAKVLFEYGLVGCLLFWPMLLMAVFGNAPSIWLALALMIGFLTFGGEFLDPRLQTLLLVFCVLPKRMAIHPVSRGAPVNGAEDPLPSRRHRNSSRGYYATSLRL